MKKIAIVGIGALGSILGGYLTRGGEDVTLICSSWREHARAMKERGLTIKGIAREQSIPVKSLFIDELAQLKEKVELLFIATKSNDTRRVLDLVKAYLAPGAWVVSCQNGINEDVIIPIVGAANTMGCVTRMGGALWEPGCVTETRVGGVGFVIGELDCRSTPRIQELARILALCRETQITTDIYLERWMKLGENSMFTALAAITGLGLRELHQSEPANRVAARILVEVIEVAENLGYPIESVAGIDSALWKKAAHSWLPEIHRSLYESGAKFGSSVGSMLADLMKGRLTEIDYINGYVVKRGQEIGVPVPINEVIVGMVKAIERGENQSTPDHLTRILKLPPKRE